MMGRPFGLVMNPRVKGQVKVLDQVETPEVVQMLNDLPLPAKLASSVCVRVCMLCEGRLGE